MRPALILEEPAQAATHHDVWDRLVRTHDDAVIASVMALGLPSERAKELAHLAWSELYEKFVAGAIADASFPGLAIRHARFRALDALRRDARESRRRANVDADDVTALDPAPRPLSSEQIDAVKQALAACAPTQQKLFKLVYDGVPHAEIAERLGLSVQRVRQSLCELRKKLRLVLEETR